MSYDLDKLESFEEQSKRSFFKPGDHEGKTCFIAYKGYDENRPGWEGAPTKMVNADIIVNEGNGEFTTFYNQWVKGAVIFGFFSKRKAGEVFVRKLVQLPPQKKGQQGAWAFNSTDQESFDATLSYVKAKEEETKKAVEALGDDDGAAPWAS